MSVDGHPPETSPTAVAPPAAPRPLRLLRAILPHLLTATLAVLISLGLQAALPPPVSAPLPSPTLPIVTPTPPPTAAPTAPPLPTAPPPASGITRQELLDLRTEDDRIWSAIYLSRAISQVADAENALRVNDLERADQTLVAIDASLGLAYARTPDTMRDPIVQLRRDAGALREDLYLRPEGMDLRLARFRQTLLALIAER
jgi:hypothetical protein